MIVDIAFGEYDSELAHLPFAEIALAVLEYESMPENTSVSLAFASEEEIAALNFKYRGKEGPTDVLSFECDGLDDGFDDGFYLAKAAVVPEAEDSEAAEYAESYDEFLLGDVVIAPEVARVRAGEFGMSFSEELCFLLIHGILHLCGYDHVEEADAEEMEELEKSLFKPWKKALEGR